MKKVLLTTLLVLLFSSFTSLFACTSGIITGKLTTDGRPLMFKHRDTGELNNRIEYFTGEKYSFLALVNSPSKGGEVWSGSNEKGFCIMNTASYNLKDDDIDSKYMDKEGVLMYKALAVCENLKDFEKFLDTLSRPMGVEANFGVIDAQGGAAYYEVNNHKWTKFDVNDKEVAPEGYYIQTNFSFSGRVDKGSGYIRHSNGNYIMENRDKSVKIDAQWIIDNISRSFYHSQLDMDLRKDDIVKNGWFIDQDFIPRKSTSASTVFQGVMPGEDPAMTIMWNVVGYPPLAVAVPTIMKFADKAPSYIVKSEKSNNCELCDLSLEVKKEVFSIKRGNGSKYFNFGLLYNKEGNGYSQRLAESENYIFDIFNTNLPTWRKNGVTAEALTPFYNEYYLKIKSTYDSILKK